MLRYNWIDEQILPMAEALVYDGVMPTSCQSVVGVHRTHDWLNDVVYGLKRAALVDFLEVDRGGHVGFVCAGNPQWLEDTILDWLGNSSGEAGAA